MSELCACVRHPARVVDYSNPRRSTPASRAGDGSGATAAIGSNNSATTIGDGSGTVAAIGDNNTARVTGDNSTALAGGTPNPTPHRPVRPPATTTRPS
jgi:hypothetical protein